MIRRRLRAAFLLLAGMFTQAETSQLGAQQLQNDSSQEVTQNQDMQQTQSDNSDQSADNPIPQTNNNNESFVVDFPSPPKGLSVEENNALFEAEKEYHTYFSKKYDPESEGVDQNQTDEHNKNLDLIKSQFEKNEDYQKAILEFSYEIKLHYFKLDYSKFKNIDAADINDFNDAFSKNLPPLKDRSHLETLPEIQGEAVHFQPDDGLALFQLYSKDPSSPLFDYLKHTQLYIDGDIILDPEITQLPPLIIFGKNVDGRKTNLAEFNYHVLGDANFDQSAIEAFGPHTQIDGKFSAIKTKKLELFAGAVGQEAKFDGSNVRNIEDRARFGKLVLDNCYHLEKLNSVVDGDLFIRNCGLREIGSLTRASNLIAQLNPNLQTVGGTFSEGVTLFENSELESVALSYVGGKTNILQHGGELKMISGVFNGDATIWGNIGSIQNGQFKGVLQTSARSFLGRAEKFVYFTNIEKVLEGSSFGGKVDAENSALSFWDVPVDKSLLLSGSEIREIGSHAVIGGNLYIENTENLVSSKARVAGKIFDNGSKLQLKNGAALLIDGKQGNLGRPSLGPETILIASDANAAPNISRSPLTLRGLDDFPRVKAAKPYLPG